MHGQADGIHGVPRGSRPTTGARPSAIEGLERVPSATCPTQTPAHAGGALHGLRHALLPHGQAHQRHGERLPDQQPHPGVERPRLPRAVAARRSIRLHKTNNFPEFTGRVCPAPCEGSCTRGASNGDRGHHQDHRGVRSSTRACAEGWMKPEPPRIRTGNKVAVVGSGAGRTRLRRAAQPGRPHGHRLRARRPRRRAAHVRHPEHEARQARVRRSGASSLMADTGMRFSAPACEVGNDTCAVARCIQRLRRGRCSAPGPPKPRDLPVDGTRASRASTSRWTSSPRNTTSLLDSGACRRALHLRRRGRDVVVIGGGDTGTDCVRHVDPPRRAERGAARDPARARPTRAPADNPWPQWPQRLSAPTTARRRRRALRRGPAHLLRSPRRSSSATRRGGVEELHTVKVEWGEGRRRALRAAGESRLGTRSSRPTSCCSPSGFTGPAADGRRGGARRPARRSAATSRPTTRGQEQSAAWRLRGGRRVAGEQSLVVRAIHEGRRAARGVDRFLSAGRELPAGVGYRTPAEVSRVAGAGVGPRSACSCSFCSSRCAGRSRSLALLAVAAGVRGSRIPFRLVGIAVEGVFALLQGDS